MLSGIHFIVKLKLLTVRFTTEATATTGSDSLDRSKVMSQIVTKDITSNMLYLQDVNYVPSYRLSCYIAGSHNTIIE